MRKSKKWSIKEALGLSGDAWSCILIQLISCITDTSNYLEHIFVQVRGHNGVISYQVRFRSI